MKLHWLESLVCEDCGGRLIRGSLDRGGQDYWCMACTKRAIREDQLKACERRLAQRRVSPGFDDGPLDNRVGTDRRKAQRNDQRGAAAASDEGILPPVKSENSGTQSAPHPSAEMPEHHSYCTQVLSGNNCDCGLADRCFSYALALRARFERLAGELRERAETSHKLFFAVAEQKKHAETAESRLAECKRLLVEAQYGWRHICDGGGDATKCPACSLESEIETFMQRAGERK